MARQNGTAATKTEEDQKKDQNRADHAKLIGNVNELREKREFVLRTIQSPILSPVLHRYEKDIEDTKEYLVSCDKKDIDRLQADVKARRTLIATLKASYESELQDASRQLEEFKKHNALFLVPHETVNQDTGEVVTA